MQSAAQVARLMRKCDHFKTKHKLVLNPTNQPEDL
jgi:hypothetical protein